jgi:hypothetical protein
VFSWQKRKFERETGIEPATFSLARKHSTDELLPRARVKYTKNCSCAQILDKMNLICHSKEYMRKILVSATVFSLTPIILIISIIFLSNLASGNFPIPFQKNNQVAYAALPYSNQAYFLTPDGKDARVERIRDFFVKYDSELAHYADFVVEMADKYDLDYRLVPAIAMQESTLCKKAPKDSYNCWGFGVYGKKVTRFSDYKEAIETVTKGLSLNYKEAGLVEPHEIMTKYTPSNDGTWAKNVASLMDGLQI